MNINNEEIQNRNDKALKTSETSQETISHPDFYLEDERLLILQKLCNTINPYDELSLEEKFLLKEFGIDEDLNPFSLTNKLIFLLEENIQYRTTLEQKK